MVKKKDKVQPYKGLNQTLIRVLHHLLSIFLICLRKAAHFCEVMQLVFLLELIEYSSNRLLSKVQFKVSNSNFTLSLLVVILNQLYHLINVLILLTSNRQFFGELLPICVLSCSFTLFLLILGSSTFIQVKFNFIYI